tara:strand:+ start:601 stop:1293 length:693 start_codon:yes stop_codon:yes gene_type:complete
MMKVCIHQPNYLPWLGFFNKVAQSDTYVVFDDVQYPRGKDWANRNQIKTNNGKLWLTIPVIGKSELRQWKDIEIANSGWNRKHIANINNFYRKSKYFDLYYSDLEKFYNKDYIRLIDLNVDLIKYFCGILNIDTDIVYSSDICGDKEFDNGLDKILYILEELKTTEYITGAGAGSERYIIEDEFKKRDIKLTWNDYQHPEYNQLHGDFESHLAIIDLLFNEGNESRKFII